MHDPVTGFREGRLGTARPETLRRAQAFIEQSMSVDGDNYWRGAYLELDIRNLGGLNAALGHSGADKVYGRIAVIIREELRELGVDVSLFRHGGDEMSAVVVGADAAQVNKAMQRAQDRVAEYVRTTNRNGTPLSQIPHPKHPDDPSKKGTGFTSAAEDIDPERAPGDIIAAADTRLERKKSGPRHRSED
jgi:GGDEF domain-containing protein